MIRQKIKQVVKFHHYNTIFINIRRFLKNGCMQYKSIILPCWLLIMAGFLSMDQVKAQDYRFGLGLRLSTSAPTLNNSVSGKYFVTDRGAVEGLLTIGPRVAVGGMLQVYKPFTVEGLKWFYGGGVYVGFEDNETHFGPTGIAGLDYKFSHAPINVSLDWKPELDILPAIIFIPDAFALSVRFTF
jgi:hypothetical protein